MKRRGTDGHRRRRWAATLSSVAVITTTIASGCRPIDDRGAAYATSQGGGTLRVAMADPAYQGFDPQASYTQPQFELLRCCLVRTLMTYRGIPDFAGTQPVPDLATGYPSVSSDGTTWTFRLKRGIHYAPPLEDVEVTAGDIVRAVMRAGSEDAGGGPGAQYLTLIEGFAEYAKGSADAIAGISTPDEYTVRLQETRSDRSIVHLFAMAFTAPIPPSPDDPSAPFGTATGHPFASDFDGGPPDKVGYGPFLVSSGPYMLEGAPDLDLNVPPRQQRPTSSFSPGWWFDDPGSIVLVRNPSWEAATDANRPALADRIEISIMPADNPYRSVETGNIDLVMGENPPPPVLRRYQSSGTLRGRIALTTGNFSRFVTMNAAQPPFDDVHVRRAIALVLDRASLAAANEEPIATHLIPEPMIGSLLSSWNPFPSADDAGDVASAREEMNASRYGAHGTCSDPACRRVRVPHPFDATEAVEEILRAGLRSIGIHPIFRAVDCADPRTRAGLCMTGWFTDFPDAGNMVVPFLYSDEGFNPTHLGASPQQLRRWGYDTRRVPNVDSDHERCASLAGVQAAMCWARLDQLLTSELAALVPISSVEIVRVRGAGVAEYSLDQAFGEPSLDRIAVAG